MGEFRQKATVKLFESGDYTLSAYLKTTGLTVTSGYKGAFLQVTANGTVYESRPALSSTADRGVGTFASGWERLSVCFPFEYGEDTSVAIELVCDAKSGTLYWGCPQVESGRMANAFNLVTDGDFSLTTNNTAASTTRLFPKQWKVTGNGVSTSTLNCIVTDRAVNGLPDSVSGNAMRLTCVNDPHENATWIYSYDRGGNIQNKAKHAYTTEEELGEAIESIPYTYGDANWKDKLTAYNGVSITYDAIGNPLSDGTWTYEWQAGRQLKRMTNATTGVTMEFTYNHAGLRTKKVKKVNGVLAETTEYILSGKNVVGLTYTDHVSNEVDVMRFFCDRQGKVAWVDYNGVVYAYIRNLQGDVVGMIDNNGSLVVEYKYSAWGGLVSSNGSQANTLGRRNPVMYRGYMRDDETGMYYLLHRYYKPEIQRFENADSCYGEANRYAYCMNCPVMRLDNNGCKSQTYDVVFHYMYNDSNSFHGAFEIGGVMFSYEGRKDKGVWVVYDAVEYTREKWRNDKTITLHGVTQEMMKTTFREFDKNIPNLPNWTYSERIMSDNVYDAFKGSFKKYNTWYRARDKKEYPCMAAMYEATSSLEFDFEEMIGPVTHSIDDDTKVDYYAIDSYYYDPESYWNKYIGGYKKSVHAYYINGKWEVSW